MSRPRTKPTIDHYAKRKANRAKPDGYIGVGYDSQKKKYRVILHIGFFADEEQAARAYDRAAQAVFGDNVNLNFPK